jgi:hypothetical protein
MNVKEFVMTRKFWEPIVQLVLTIITWSAPQILKVDIPPEALLIITAVLWGIAGLVVHGDIKYDWNQIELQKIIHSSKG